MVYQSRPSPSSRYLVICNQFLTTLIKQKTIHKINIEKRFAELKKKSV